MRGQVLLIAVLSTTAANSADTIDFNRDVRPILSAKCFNCHGPDPKTREAELRLDTHEGLFERRNETAAFVPDEPAGSEALRRILSDDEFEKMPPPEAKKELTEREIAIIKAWVEQGARWEPHWAFIPPKYHVPPKVMSQSWPRNAIDHFVLARLEEKSLKPSPEADKYTLVRRVYLDLIGLPPTPAQADAFVNDDSPDAYEQLVDRLLASPHYGERWARRWLDLARYADTNGYEKDRPRSIWPYRDWVIESLNAGMPFDDFTIKQIAGDMLPNATLQDRIATGFHRNTMLNEEGGIDPLEFRYHAMTDRVATTGTTWLGLTTGCAQCHDHKYDPISHREYFGLMAFLNNADEPELPLPDPSIDATYASNLKRAAQLLKELPSKWPLEHETGWMPARLAEASSESGQIPEHLDDGSVFFARGDADRDSYTLIIESDLKSIDRIRLEAVADSRLPSGGPGQSSHGNFVISEITVTGSELSGGQAIQDLKIQAATSRVEQVGFAAAAAIDGDDKTGWAVHVPGQSLNVNHAIDLTFEQPIRSSLGVRLHVVVDQKHGGHHTVGRLRVLVPASLGTARPTTKEIVEDRFQKWLDHQRGRNTEWITLRPLAVGSNLPLLTVQDDGSVFVTGDTTKHDTYRVTLPLEDRPVRSLRLEALPDDRLPSGGPGMTYYEGTPGDFFLTELRVKADDEPVKIVGTSHSYAKNRFGNNPATAAMAVDGDLQTGWSVDGRQGERHSAIFVLEKPVASDKLELEMDFGRHFASSLGRFRWSVSETDNAEARDLSPEVEALLAKPASELTAAELELLKHAFLLQVEELAPHAAKIRALRKRPDNPTSLVFVERPAENPRPTFLHNRGEFLQPTEEVAPITLESLHPYPKELPKDRLGFAQWLVSEDNPLTARVVVNRHWTAFFGRGLVPTVQDFGFQGEPPSHPELLDWLAVEFMAAGGSKPDTIKAKTSPPAAIQWDLKHLHRMIVSSATYRQSSHTTPDFRERDPQNTLLSRGPRLRLEAEMIRDTALLASSLLAPKLGGEPVRPPQPDGVTESAYGSPKWNADEGQNRYRRSIYTFIKRTAPFALYSVFDAPSGEACIAKRDVSNTALQSLTLLNDVVFVEAAQALGRATANEHGEDDEKLRLIFRKMLTREPTQTELDRLMKFVALQRERFRNDLASAKAITELNEEDVVEQAVWTAVSRALLSLDEVITRS